MPTQPLPQVFGQALYNQSKFAGLQLSQDMGPSQLAHHAPHQQSHQPQQQQPSLADTVSAATAAITADPNFTAALAAAISSIISGGHPNNKHLPHQHRQWYCQHDHEQQNQQFSRELGVGSDHFVCH